MSAKILQGSAKAVVEEIVVHCSATRADWMHGRPFAEKVKEIRRWHVENNKWKDIGYHWLIDRDGAVLPGRPETVIGAGVLGHNTGVIHICLLGGHGSSANDQFERHFTAAQEKALLAKIADIRNRTPIKLVTGHNDYAAKACPGFRVAPWHRARTAGSAVKPTPAPTPVTPPPAKPAAVEVTQPAVKPFTSFNLWVWLASIFGSRQAK